MSGQTIVGTAEADDQGGGDERGDGGGGDEQAGRDPEAVDKARAQPDMAAIPDEGDAGDIDESESSEDGPPVDAREGGAFLFPCIGDRGEDGHMVEQ